jgi:hypothetical protein
VRPVVVRVPSVRFCPVRRERTLVVAVCPLTVEVRTPPPRALSELVVKAEVLAMVGNGKQFISVGPHAPDGSIPGSSV